MSNLQMKYA